MSQKGSILGATLLVAGTCIGGGMLALPLVTASAGFFPSLLMILIGWGFMTLTAFYLAEVNQWMGKDAHIISMASRFLGPIGKIVAWALYLFMGYASLVAYTAGGSELFQKGLQSIGWSLGLTEATILFTALFGLIIYLGNIVVGRVNTLLMIGLIASYILLISSGLGYIKAENVMRFNFGSSVLLAVPLLLTIFSFQTIIPSLMIYLKQDAKALRRSIFLGTFSALTFYVIWELLVLGAVPYEGVGGLFAALKKGTLSSDCLGDAVNNRWVCFMANFFAFFALVTSFLGIALGLFDFLSDGLRIPKKNFGKILLGILVAVPTLVMTLSFENIFLKALDATGGIGDALLNGILPCLMVWVGRYRENLNSEFRVGGGRPLILVAIGYALFVFIVEMLGKFGTIVTFE